MASQIQQIATSYLKKHSVPASEFGLAAYLRNGKSLSVVRNPIFSGMLVYLGSPQDYVDCASLACRMQKDILLNNPEINPIVMRTASGDAHFWVEVSCPVSEEKTQIDATPWYNRINPGHMGERVGQHVDCPVPLSAGNGVALTVSPISGGTITTVLGGWFPENAKYIDPYVGLAHLRFGNGARPKFEFQAFPFIKYSSLSDSAAPFKINFGVYDAAAFKKSVLANDGFDTMVCNGVIKTSISTSIGTVQLGSWGARQAFETHPLLASAMHQVDANVQWMLELMKKAAELF